MTSPISDRTALHHLASGIGAGSVCADLSSSSLSVGVIGASGYHGREVLSLLAGRADVEVVFASSRSAVGEPTAVADVRFTDPFNAPLAAVDLLFLCLPHGEAVAWVERMAEGQRVIDFTADHRLGSGREGKAAYGLSEWNQHLIKSARVVANPGCYPTGVLTALCPIARASLIDRERLTVVNAASGVTGAGRTPRPDLLFAEVAENYSPYAEGNRHRHLKEMRPLLDGIPLLFQPHRLPIRRGILVTITLPTPDGVGAVDIRTTWQDIYADSRAISVLPSGLPSISAVAGTDRLLLGVCDVEGFSPPVVTVVVALDNLGKGTAGQAVQNMNIMFGWPIDRGIRV